MTWHPIRSWRTGIVSAGIPAGMHGPFESGSGGVAQLNHRLHAGMPPASPSEDRIKGRGVHRGPRPQRTWHFIYPPFPSTGSSVSFPSGDISIFLDLHVNSPGDSFVLFQDTTLRFHSKNTPQTKSLSRQCRGAFGKRPASQILIQRHFRCIPPTKNLSEGRIQDTNSDSYRVAGSDFGSKY
jgi:hypothetical protein